MTYDQVPIVEQEIFFAIVQEAGSLPTAQTRVSERLAVIEASQGTELWFELVSSLPYQRMLVLNSLLGVE